MLARRMVTYRSSGGGAFSPFPTAFYVYPQLYSGAPIAPTNLTGGNVIKATLSGGVLTLQRMLSHVALSMSYPDSSGHVTVGGWDISNDPYYDWAYEPPVRFPPGWANPPAVLGQAPIPSAGARSFRYPVGQLPGSGPDIDYGFTQTTPSSGGWFYTAGAGLLYDSRTGLLRQLSSGATMSVPSTAFIQSFGNGVVILDVDNLGVPSAYSSTIAPTSTRPVRQKLLRWISEESASKWRPLASLGSPAAYSISPFMRSLNSETLVRSYGIDTSGLKFLGVRSGRAAFLISISTFEIERSVVGTLLSRSGDTLRAEVLRSYRRQSTGVLTIGTDGVSYVPVRIAEGSGSFNVWQYMTDATATVGTGEFASRPSNTTVSPLTSLGVTASFVGSPPPAPDAWLPAALFAIEQVTGTNNVKVHKFDVDGSYIGVVATVAMADGTSAVITSVPHANLLILSSGSSSALDYHGSVDGGATWFSLGISGLTYSLSASALKSTLDKLMPFFRL